MSIKPIKSPSTLYYPPYTAPTVTVRPPAPHSEYSALLASLSPPLALAHILSTADQSWLAFGKAGTCLSLAIVYPEQTHKNWHLLTGIWLLIIWWIYLCMKDLAIETKIQLLEIIWSVTLTYVASISPITFSDASASTAFFFMSSRVTSWPFSSVWIFC